jgi:hypothetical protein
MEIPVTNDDGIRPHPSNWTKEPEKATTHCLYCRQPVPNHSAECVVPQRTVVVELITRMVITMPRSLDEDAINFSMNGPSACQSRYIDQLHAETHQEEGYCHICQRTEMKYLREATEQDHKELSFQQ